MSIGGVARRRTPEPKPAAAVEVPQIRTVKRGLEIVTAARACWKGSLKLSLVSCPVLLYPASTTSDKTRFHMINRETGNQLKQQMIDAETGTSSKATRRPAAMS
jgi:hypothetical protein